MSQHLLALRILEVWLHIERNSCFLAGSLPSTGWFAGQNLNHPQFELLLKPTPKQKNDFFDFSFRPPACVEAFPRSWAKDKAQLSQGSWSKAFKTKHTAMVLWANKRNIEKFGSRWVTKISLSMLGDSTLEVCMVSGAKTSVIPS